MNSLDSIFEPIQNISTFMDGDHNCAAFDKITGELCGETESLKIINELQKLYETRIKNVDREYKDEFDQVCVKLEISKEWIKNLREQNVMLVQTVEDLEQAACNKVKLLEQRLKHSSMIVSENITNSSYTEKTIHALSNRINDLEKDEKYMRQRIEFLQSDIRGLLELIRRAVQENHWNLDDIKFFEIESNDIPIPANCACDQEETSNKRIQSLKLQIEHLQENEKKMIEHQKELEDKLADLNKKLETKEDTIKSYISQLQNFSENFKKHVKFPDQVTYNSFAVYDQQPYDELLKKQDTLTVELIQKTETVTFLQKQMAVLQEQCQCANMQINFKKDIIKKLRKKLKQAIAKETHVTSNICIDTNAYHKDQIISYLTKVKSLMEQEKDDLFQLQVELERAVEKNQEYEVVKNIDCVNKMCSKKEESIAIINSIILKLENNIPHIESANLFLPANSNQQFKLMDIFRACAIEAQDTTEDIKDEMNTIISSFKSRHQKYVDLNKEVTNVQNQLIRSREKITEAINRLQIQEEEKSRHDKRIRSGKIKLKDIKNELNQAESQLLLRINNVQNNIEEENTASNYTQMHICNHLLHSVINEVEQISNTLQVFHPQEYCITSDLEELKGQLCNVDSSIKLLQQRIEEALLEHDIVEATLYQQEQKLKQLEKKIDVIHSKIQDISKTCVLSKNQASDINLAESQLCNQTLDEVLEIKQDLHRLKREHDELKHRLSQKLDYTECDEKTCLWKCRVTDLQDQVKILQHEGKCNQEANNFLKNNIKLLEKELHATQIKAENYRRSHFMDNIELKKKIVKLENTLKSQEEIECNLQQQLTNSETELKKSKELLHSFHIEKNIEEILHCECSQFKHDTMTVSQLFKTLENTMRSTKNGLQELKTELKELISEKSPDFCSPARSLMNLVDKLQKYEDELVNCSQEIEKLKNTLYSKDKLLENMDEIIKIQKDSIVMTQAELKEIHQKLQEKINNQDQIISQYEKEKKELLKQNELQIQTIGHLQNAVVEAKKCIDQMRQRTMSDLQEKSDTVRLLTVQMEETQSQYSECFAEAAKQDKLLELQRDVIYGLQQRIYYMEYRNHLTTSFICITHYSILKTIQEQLEIRVNDIQTLKYKIDTLAQSKCYLETKYLNMKKSWQEAEGKLQELKKIAKSEQKSKIYEDKESQCEMQVENKECITEDIFFNNLICNNGEVQFKNDLYEYDLQSEIKVLTRENEDMKRQLQKCKMDFDIINKELKIERENEINIHQISFELQKMRDTECCLRYENEQLRSDLEKQTQKTENLLEKLQFVKANGVKFEKMFKKLEEKQMQINILRNEILNNEVVMNKQTETIKEFEKKLDVSNKQIEGYLSELNEAEEEMLTLHNRIQSLKTMLIKKSDDMVKLQADYEVLKNDNSILKMENNVFENKTKEDVCQLKNMLKDLQMQLRLTKDNYHRVTEDFNKTQDQLIKITKREADLQEYLTNMEKDYYSKLSNIEKEKAKLRDCLDKLRDELEDIQKNYSLKNNEYYKLQDICKSYTEQLEILQQQVEKERDRVKSLEESNNCIMQQMQECMSQNCVLIKEKALIEQNNCKIVSELQETHKSLLELRKECHLKNKSLACISAELTETAMSRSELCNQSQYVVSCIRIWMEEQREYVNKLNSKLKSQQQQLIQLEFEKKAVLDETKKLRRINHLFIQRLKRIHRYGGKYVKNVCVGCHIVPSVATQNAEILIPISSKQPFSQKKQNFTKVARRISACGNAWWFPKMKYLINELRKCNLKYNENFYNQASVDTLEENRDCGYQSSTSK